MEDTEEYRAHLHTTFSVTVNIDGTEKPGPSPVLKIILSMNLDEMSEAEVIDRIEKADSKCKWTFDVNTSEVESEEDFDSSHEPSITASRQLKYVREHLPKEIAATVKQFFHDEWIIIEAYDAAPDAGAKFREMVVQKILRRYEKRLKERLPRTSGRPPAKQCINYHHEKLHFMKTCFEILRTFRKDGIKETKTNLAETLFNRENSNLVSNPVKALNGQLRKFELAFEELVESSANDWVVENLNVDDLRIDLEEILRQENKKGEVPF